MRSLFVVILAAGGARAQTIKGAVLAKNEPHHHLAYADDVLRVLRVHVAPHDTTLLHEHDADYIWIALGASTIVNAKLGAPDAIVTSKDLTVHYTPGKFAHVARNQTDKPFDNITIELLQPQTNPRNLCEEAIAGQRLQCEPVSSQGVTQRPAVATDQLRATLVTIDPGRSVVLGVGGQAAWVVALDTTTAGKSLTVSGHQAWKGGTLRVGAGVSELRNRGATPVRAMFITASMRK
jgi:hypothetical protein